jgi:hypothetical protein
VPTNSRFQVGILDEDFVGKISAGPQLASIDRTAYPQPSFPPFEATNAK